MQEGRSNLVAAGLAALLLVLAQGASAASIVTHEATMDQIYSQGILNIDIRFTAPGAPVVDPALLSLDSQAEINALFAMAPAASPTVNMFFVDEINVCGGVSQVFIGCADQPGNRMVIAATGASVAELTAHELGHNLGLWHVDDFFNLMDPRVTGQELTSSQQSQVLSSPLVQTDALGDYILITPILVVPEPGTLALLLMGLAAIHGGGRRGRWRPPSRRAVRRDGPRLEMPSLLGFLRIGRVQITRAR